MPRNGVKPGHWMAAVQRMKANNEDFLGQLHADCVDSSGREIRLQQSPYSTQFSRPATLPKGQTKHFELLFLRPSRWSAADAADPIGHSSWRTAGAGGCRARNATGTSAVSVGRPVEASRQLRLSQEIAERGPAPRRDAVDGSGRGLYRIAAARVQTMSTAHQSPDLDLNRLCAVG